VTIKNLLAWIEGPSVATRGYRRIFRPHTASVRETCKTLQQAHSQEQEHAKEFGPHERNSKVVEFKQSWSVQGEKGQVQARPEESSMKSRSRLLRAIFEEVDVEQSGCLSSALANSLQDMCTAHVKKALLPAAVPKKKISAEEDKHDERPSSKPVARKTHMMSVVGLPGGEEDVLDDEEEERKEAERQANLPEESTVDLHEFEELLAPAFDLLSTSTTAPSHKDTYDSTVDIIFKDVKAAREKVWQRLQDVNVKLLAQEVDDDEALPKLHKIKSRQAEDGRPDDWKEAIIQLQAADFYVPPVVHHSRNGAISDMLRMVAVTRW